MKKSVPFRLRSTAAAADVEARPEPFEDPVGNFPLEDDVVEHAQKLRPADAQRVRPEVHQARFVDQRLTNIEKYR